ncbi:MAG TPA: HepT-like ribonuclease domain-containing protein [Jiangellaceae bacterium]|nr:HepT-like ribonuclease domain-containing protein [Jiangellaceae bacterium]
MRAAVGFRNVLVHQYGDVDMSRTAWAIWADLDAFASRVVRLLASRG